MPVVPSRVVEIFTEWNRLSSSTEPSDASLFEGAADVAASNSIAVVIGTNGMSNIRTLGMAQYMFAALNKPENIAVLLTRPSKEAPLAECSLTVYTAGAPVDPATQEATGDTPKITIMSGEDEGTKAAFTALLTEATANGNKIICSEKDLTSQTTDAGAFSASLIAALKGMGTVDGHAMLGALLYSKDKDAITAIKKVSAVSLGHLLKNWLVPEITQQASAVTKVKCSRLSQMCDDKLSAPHTITSLQKLQDHSSFGSWVATSILPQGHFNEKIAAATSPQLEMPTTSVVVRLCPRYREQYGYIARTFFFDTDSLPKNAKAVYTFAQEMEAAVTANIKVGKTTKEVFEETMVFANTLNPTLAANIHPELGFLTGPVVMEKRTKISADGQVMIRAGMTFVVRVVLKDVKIEGSEGTFDVEIADTIFVGETLENKAIRQFEDILVAVDGELGTASVRIQTRASKSGVVPGEEDVFREKQKLIWELKHHSHTKKGASVVDDNDLLFAGGRLAHGSLQSYNTPAAIPAEIKSLKQATVWVDKARQTAWLPMDEIHMAPFHISVINKVDVKAEGASGFSLTVGFASTQEANIPFKNNRTKVFIKELSYQSDQSREFDIFCRTVNDVKKTIKDDDARLKLEKGAIPVTNRGLIGRHDNPLKDVEFRPAPVTGRGRCRGHFEARDNGFMFQMLGATVEILYDNVKLAICQPCQNDTYTIFHLSLHRPVLLGRKSTTEVQVVAEVLESSESISAGNGMSYDQDLAIEAREKLRIDATNRQFLVFARDVKGKIGGDKVCVPRAAVDFEGNVGKGSVRFRGSDQGLWAISEMPFFSLRLEDYEVVVLERVIVGGGNFDLAFIPHNYKAPTSVSNVSMAELVNIKRWLCGANMPFMESTINLNYNMLFKTIRTDEEWEPFGDGGWRVMAEDSDGEEEDEEDSSWHESDESDSSYGSEDEDSEDWASESSSAATEDSTPSDIVDSEYGSDESEYSSEDSPVKKRGARVETRRRV